MLMANAKLSIFQAVKATLKRTCKCHGVSGSCSIQTCWTQLADFREIGTYLKIKHDQAKKLEMDKTRMRAGNSADNRGAITDTFSTVSGTELIYMEDSPDYCAKNLSLGQHGTEGRECLQSGKNLSQWEKRSCKRLCHECGLKVEERRIETVSSCNCKFHWCCTVKCETCTQIVTKYVCAKRHKNRRPHNNSRRRQHARNRWTHLCKYINLYISNVNIWDFKICSFFSYCILFCIPASILDTGAFSFQLSIELITC